MFYSGQYRYRKTSVFCGGVLALIVGAAPVALLVSSIRQTVWSKGTTGVAVLVGLVCVTLLWLGFRLLRLWIKGVSLPLEITEEGVRYGPALHRWSDIKWIGGVSGNGYVQLTLKREGAARELPLSVDHPLTVARYDALMQELSVALRGSYPELAVG